MAFSYWSKRRRVLRNVDAHLRLIADDEIEKRTSLTEVSTSVRYEQSPDDGRATLPDDIISTNDGNDETINDNGSSNLGDLGDASDIDIHLFSDSSSDHSIDETSHEQILDTETLRFKLVDWAIDNSVSLSTLASLLGILQVFHPSLPKDPRALLKTPRMYENSEIKVFNDGISHYYHFGVRAGIANAVKSGDVAGIYTLSLIVNTDGLQLFRSSNVQFWPILGIVKEARVRSPFLIGLYCGNRKPPSVDEFFSAFVEELKIIQRDGITIHGDHFTVCIDCFVCDAPARSFAKNVKLCGSYFGCEKCIQQGEWHGRVTYQECHASLRTDNRFADMAEADHHHGTSPLTELGVGMVSQFPIDYMHLVCLGVMRRLLMQWVGKGPTVNCRLPARLSEQISSKLISLRSSVPREFARKPRSVKEIDRWKATEFRQFLFYTGPVVLHGILDDAVYNHFLVLYVALSLLANPLLCIGHCDYAESLLIAFVEETKSLYGKQFLVYNVHNLIHLAADVRKFGCFDNFSAFPFENYMRKIKKFVHKAELPLQQVVRRLSEMQSADSSNSHISVTRPKQPLCKKEHADGPVPAGFEHCYQFTDVLLGSLFLSSKVGDNCIVGEDGKYYVIVNIVSHNNRVSLVCKEFSKLSDFFQHPLPSSSLGICKVSKPVDIISLLPIAKVSRKCALFDIGCGKFVAIPLLHNDQ